MNLTSNKAVFHHIFTVPDDAIDTNGHVNNVTYIQWMQDAAVRHSDACGGTAAMHACGGTWVVRSHSIEYLQPAYAGDDIDLATWVVDFRRVRSLRRYRFSHHKSGLVLAKGETLWVYVDGATGRPCTVPETVKNCFPLAPDIL